MKKRMSNTKWMIVGGFLTMSLMACGKSSDSTPANCDGAPTFAQIQADILTASTTDNKRCLNCHSAARPAKISLEGFDAVSTNASKMLSRMNDNASPMPPSGKLASDKIDLFKKWVDCGKKQ